jgi:hypothetical protein
MSRDLSSPDEFLIVSGESVNCTQFMTGPRTASCPAPESCDIPPASVVHRQWTRADSKRQSGRRAILRGVTIVLIRTGPAVLAASMIGDRGIIRVVPSAAFRETCCRLPGSLTEWSPQAGPASRHRLRRMKPTPPVRGIGMIPNGPGCYGECLVAVGPATRPIALDVLIIRVPRITWFTAHIVLRSGRMRTTWAQED